MQPGENNCAGCSPSYTFGDGGELMTMETFTNNGDGATSDTFMCDLGEF